MQAALEAEVTGFLGRDRCARAALTEDARPGSRNGYWEVTVKTTAGPVALARPKLRGAAEAFASRLAEALGDQAAISKSSVSVICQQIKDQYEAWALRRLDGVQFDYLFLDAGFFRMHPGLAGEPVLAAWGITTDGKPAFIGLGLGAGESFDACHGFLADLRDRGLASPLLVVSDGAPGLIGAID